MPVEDKKAMVDGVAWFMNVATSVVIVFVNKILMDPSTYRFSYGKNAHYFKQLCKACAMVITRVGVPTSFRRGG